MNLDNLKRVNALWKDIYPYLASQIIDAYEKKSGKVLELGPFSGGISFSLAGICPKLTITIADNSSQVLHYLQREIEDYTPTVDIKTKKTTLNPLDFNDSQFDLVIFRGAFFFLDDKGDHLREIFRVLRQGGMAFIGGGYGKDTPARLIDQIGDESRELNDKLGRKRISVGRLRDMVKNSDLNDKCRIVQEGGLWLVFRK